MESTQIPRTPREGRTERLIFSHDLLHHEPSGLISGRGASPLGSKIQRAHGGCLGIGSRRRARQAAISPGEAQTAFDPGIPEWGNPAGVMPCYPHLNQIGCEEATGGTETSKYPEERKSTETPGVAASETGPEPKPAHVQATGRCCAGVAGRDIPRACSLGRSYKASWKRNGMGRPAAAGESPVRGSMAPPRRVPE